MEKQEFAVNYECLFCNKQFTNKEEALSCNKSHKSIICVSCFSPLTVLDNTWYDNATEFTLHCNYGSRHDLEVHSLALCDKCLEKYLDYTSRK